MTERWVLTRIQRRRTKGWRLPAGAIYVGRPSRWANPFDAAVLGQRGAVDAYAVHLASYFGWEHRMVRRAFAPLPVESTAFDEWMAPLRTATALACWCPLVDAGGEPVPCHADVLIALLGQPGSLVRRYVVLDGDAP
jgi:hypothetical protein